MLPLPVLAPASLARSAALRNHLDRGSDAALDEVLARPGTVIVLAHRGSLLVSRGQLHRLRLQEPTGAAAAASREGTPAQPGAEPAQPTAEPAPGPGPLTTELGALGGTRIYLGRAADGTDCVGLLLDDASRSRVDEALARAQGAQAEDLLDAPATGLDVAAPTWFDLRALALALSDLDAGLACTLVALGNWHAAHPRSPRTGEPTEPAAGGWVRRDPTTGAEHFPRTDPAVIMAVVHTDPDGEERILLGRNAAWPQRRFSILAGFVEPGETLERAVQREVFEEAGVHCDNPRYVGSQPWPFPCSLMLGFTAEARSADLQPDGDEMSEVRWFTRRELRAAVAAEDVLIPGEVSIAGQIIAAWLTGGA
ncbi:NAD(+) diphosphatase [Brevibacterium rongguiense]|uniref:NAD(+) diphosphatase n=1 Tax=Brevibacterium rongguiense TaxID=2695267 RepID=UPI001F187091|nr:NAD(+) diphosphatase [Brevibacterium rongguiense]